MSPDTVDPGAANAPDEFTHEGRIVRVRFGALTYTLRGVTAGVAAFLRVPVSVVREGKSHLDRVDLSSARARKRFAEQAARKTGAEAATVDGHLVAILALLEGKACEEVEKSARPLFAKPESLSDADRAAAIDTLGAPGLLDAIDRDLTSLGYVGERAAKRLAFLVSISRKLPAPLAAILRSSSGSGKSALLELVARATPPEDVVFLSELTPQALYYLEKDSLKHKLLAVDERAGSERADYPIRTLLSRHTLSLAVTVADAASGGRRTRLVEVEGPVAYLESTTAAVINPENASRAFEIFLDESPEQTRRIQEEQRRRRTGVAPADRSAVLRRLRALQRCVEPAAVAIPFAPHLAFPSERPRHRRDHEKFLRLLEASALLHQHQRARSGDAVLATLDDYRVAYDLTRPVFAATTASITPAAREALAMLRDRELLEFTRRDLCRALGWSPIKVWRTLGELARGDYVVPLSNRNGVRRVYRVLEFFTHGDAATRLLPPDELARRLTVS